jgi:hypothetical protein
MTVLAGWLYSRLPPENRYSEKDNDDTRNLNLK